MRVFILAGIVAVGLVSPSVSAAREFGPTFEDLGQVDTDPTTNHCWRTFRNGRVGIASGPLPALLVQTEVGTFDESIVPSAGKQIYAGAAAETYKALIVGIQGTRVTIAIDLAILGDLVIEPHIPIALYATSTRRPARTPRAWTNDLGRKDFVSMLDCYDVQAPH